MDMPRALSPDLLSSLSEFVAARMGLHFPRERWGDLARGVAAAARELGFQEAESCAQRLLSAPLGREQMETLASCLTVGETYFFREARSLEIFEQHILPELCRVRRQAQRHLRIWSAGCCTGEEPYSIAMMLDRSLPRTEEWSVSLLATDINPRFLRKAAEGVYGDWSFRSVPEWIKDRYFEKKKNGRLELRQEIRNRVTFSHLNLAEDAYPSLANGTNAMDVIFCRNVLMYFTPERAAQVVERLRRSLVDGGWLIVSSVEISPVLFSSFSAVRFEGALVYRKDARADPQWLVITPVPAIPTGEPFVFKETGRDAATDAIPPEFPGFELKGHAPAEALQTESPEAEPSERAPAAETLLLNARCCANEGRLEEAAEWCERAISADKLIPLHHYLFAVVQQERGLAGVAAQALMRAIYLDSGFVLAHFALGNLRLSQGRRAEAERHFVNTLALLRTHAHDEVLPESEGLMAGRLAEIVTSVLSSLPRAASAGA